MSMNFHLFFDKVSDIPVWETYCIPSMGQHAERLTERSHRYGELIMEDVRYIAVHKDGHWDVARAARHTPHWLQAWTGNGDTSL